MRERGPVPGASGNREVREARAYDFGRMLRRVPEAVAAPGSVEEVSSIVRRAARGEVRLAIRGGGHSQGGQSLAEGGRVLDTMHLNRVRPLGRDLVRAQGGAQWGRVVDALRGTGRLPSGAGGHRRGDRGRNAVGRRTRDHLAPIRTAGRTGRAARGGDRNRRAGTVLAHPQRGSLRCGERRPGTVSGSLPRPGSDFEGPERASGSTGSATAISTGSRATSSGSSTKAGSITCGWRPASTIAKSL